MISAFQMTGGVSTRLSRRKKVSRYSYLARNLSNLLRGWRGWLGFPTFTARLGVVVRYHDGSVVDLGLISTRKVTTAFVNFLTDSLQGTQANWVNFKYHDSGTGSTAESNANTTMETVVTDNLRALGTQTEGASANIYRSVGTIAYTSAHSITEHGLFNDTRANGGTLMDRSVFASISVVNGDSIQFTYELTASAEA